MSNLDVIQEEAIIHKSRDSYGELIVTDSDTARSLYFGTNNKQSSMLFSNPSTLALRYTQYMAAALVFNPQAKRILLLGLGGGSLVKFLLSKSEAQLEVVELRPSVVKIAHGYFNLPEPGERLDIYIGDGLDFVLKAPRNNYDMIFTDVFDHSGPAAFVQTDVFMKAVHGLLTDRGMLCVNMWNRQVDRMHLLRRKLSRDFEGSVLEYSLGKLNSNVVFYCFKEFNMLSRLPKLQQRAVSLKYQYVLDLPRFLLSLEHQNTPLVKRLLSKSFKMFR